MRGCGETCAVDEASCAASSGSASEVTSARYRFGAGAHCSQISRVGVSSGAQGRRDSRRTHRLVPALAIRLDVLAGSESLTTPAAAEALGVHQLARLGQLDKVAVAERASTHGAGLVVFGNVSEGCKARRRGGEGLLGR